MSPREATVPPQLSTVSVFALLFPRMDRVPPLYSMAPVLLSIRSALMSSSLRAAAVPAGIPWISSYMSVAAFCSAMKASFFAR